MSWSNVFLGFISERSSIFRTPESTIGRRSKQHTVDLTPKYNLFACLKTTKIKNNKSKKAQFGMKIYDELAHKSLPYVMGWEPFPASAKLYFKWFAK